MTRASCLWIAMRRALLTFHRMPQRPRDGAPSLDEYERLHPPSPHVRYRLKEFVSPSSIALLLAIGGVTGLGYIEGDREINVSFDPALITPAEVDEKVRA